MSLRTPAESNNLITCKLSDETSTPTKIPTSVSLENHSIPIRTGIVHSSLSNCQDLLLSVNSHSKSLNPNNKLDTDIYYENFSKYILTTSTASKKPAEIFAYQSWLNNPTAINDVLLQVLKNTLKSNSQPVTGNKRELIIRLDNYYRRIWFIINIQRVFRGFLVRESERIRGPAKIRRDICNNETDFYTMESVSEIPSSEFFSYRDCNNFVYGFNQNSLMSMFKLSRKLVNPYNREEIPFAVLMELFSLYKKSLILYSRPTLNRFA